MLKILQARLQQYVNWEIPEVQAGFRKGRGTRDQTADIRWIIEKAREFQKNIYCFTDYAKAFDCVDHNKLWKILNEMGIPYNLTCLLRNLYAGQEATFRIAHVTMDWFKIGKGVCRGCIQSPCLFNFYEVSASTSVLLMNTQDWSPLGWTGWIFLQSKGLSRIISSTTVRKHQYFSGQPSLWSNSQIHAWLLVKP